MARAIYAAFYKKLKSNKKNLLLELSPLISIPDDDTPMERIIDLRGNESFQSARKALRDWQIQKMPNAICSQSERIIRLAKEEFQDMLLRYEEEMKKGKF